ILSENTNTGYINKGTPSSYLPGPNQSWILSPYNNKIRLDSGLTYRTDYQFDNKGSITCIRKRKNSGAYNSKDLVTNYTLGGVVGTNAGLPVTEILAGGENGALASGVCNTAGTEGTNKFTFSHGYTFLTLRSTRIGSFPFRYRSDIDRNTGLPTAVYNPSDQKTSMFYDRLGRITRVAPAASLGEAETLLTYTNAVGAEAQVKIERKVGATRYAFEQVVYDYFGRPRREFQSLPTGLNTSANSERVTVYDAAGRITTVSTVQQASNVNTVQKTTRFFGLDAFGRPSLILRPDGSEERWTYQGERQTQSTRLVRTSQTGSQNVAITTVYDGLGRAVSVANPEYTLVSFYDPNGKMVREERRKGAFNQSREYGWDNRGLLAFEKHPEVGSTSSLGTLSFQPDALGNPRQTFDGLNTLTHEYDGDGRLTRVRQGSKIWEEYSWANANSGADYRKGKIIQATRHNYPGGGTFSWAIVESYQYRGKLGKKSHRTTQLQWPSNPGTDRYAHTFTQTWTYDPLGDLISQTYPTCITTPENGRQYCNDPSDSLPPAHTVTRTVNQRLPVRISSNLGISADYRYHWNFQLKRIDYSNGSYTDLGQGTNGMQRPASITHRQPSGALLFATGTYSYDAAGNIWGIGDDNYVYDQASRLTRGTVRTSTRWEAYTYDAADNLLTVTRDGSLAGNYNINTAKNR
ncbi:MAG: RHS repeat protein, partial [Acidobacteria bacterium]|nr:RHS repeat protein [Acidobacteriota bacterium]